jgi:hypothetical protein
MITSRRKEPFRYQFTDSETCYFQISQLNGTKIETKPAQAELLDWHKSGCKLRSELDFRLTINEVQVMIEFPFAEREPIQVTGSIRWQNSEDAYHYYGVMFDADEELKERIKVEIRRLAAERKINAV